jgi:hypothetical protein
LWKGERKLTKQNPGIPGFVCYRQANTKIYFPPLKQNPYKSRILPEDFMHRKTTFFAYQKGLAQGRREGFAEGLEEGAISAYTALDNELQMKLRHIADQLLCYGFHAEQILSITGLSAEELSELQPDTVSEMVTVTFSRAAAEPHF